jgi:mannose-6-phosphate isomerase-like protein (cupin superfamily)
MKTEKPKPSIILKKGEGRHYHLGAMSAVFKADEEETDSRYSVSEWWLEPHADGPGAHMHEANEELFLVLEGTVSFLIGEKWVDAEKGTFLRIPAKTMHDFANHTDTKAGIFNVWIPGGFERNMPAIMNWFEENMKGK